RQVLQDSAEGGVEVNPLRNLIENNLINIRHFFFILLLVPAAWVLVRYKKALDLRTRLLIIIVLAYCALTPFMVPNDGGRQWGARYFLPVITVTLVALLLIQNEWKPRLPVWLTVLIVLMAVYSFHRNTYSGGWKTLVWENHHRISPSLEFINKQPTNIVVVSLPYIAMELGYAFDTKYFFLAPNDSSLQRLIPQLKQQGVRSYTYIYDVRLPNERAKMLTDTVAHWPHEEGDFEFRRYTIQ
ncbi:MAG TPA: hypothetical protein VGR89_05815, partial [Puia sp.]|nr:hypothetical protein [Puia sp.]